ncbi:MULTISPECIES: 2-octaprenyl-6-methoxyphenyl hydroxylase [unclassified Aliivibrio]|jgi:2-octaprenyl-6-methoxyphenol hydroxylase|uniref:2-octaprenyl-6-methoxyphenyl hydroxylase n=1 Tax=unclassified Aliivibrio TaxID=2645654 RepID=UPI00080D96AE|nr:MULTISPECIES: 2-octaprenyl-6-methoxyphenyl hydroxylase [unclassified Aliivibrio]OCH13078.1 2-octaprenyl-6-methoxyphenyl hydroxylase [Aliivibrio sp. 1S165]OCH25089.1 2-octaprenyl-6-methoxyphenyl hydroxylase [Aliivibrio sp. 1S128]OCH28233.1 2-octaprenyl-6-methoxyphenyl hydroxylase [Aliivibrio sp. 1S175]
MTHYDVVIVGGAMAGATLALVLESMNKDNLSIAVIEAVKPNLDLHPGYDSRSIALSNGTSQLLKDSNLWSEFDAFTTPIHHIHVSDRGHAGLTELTSKELNVNALGYVVELADVGRFYHQALEGSKNIDLLCPVSVTHIERETSLSTLTLSDGNVISTSLIVAADGAESMTCKSMNIESENDDFEQVAIIANVTTAINPEGKAFERFTDNGPLALLPMSQGRSSLVWCVSPEESQQILKYDDKAFLEHLQGAFGWRLGQFVKTGKRAHYPLWLRRQKQHISHRFAAIGNAAQTLHPIAGQGFNLGIRDVFSLAECLTKAHRLGNDIGEYCVLSEYQKRRQPDQIQTITMTAGLVSIFANNSFPMVVGRNVSLYGVDTFRSFLKPLTLRAMGRVNR